MPTLLLLNISGARYGVWEDAVPSVINATPLHQLPLSPAVIAGIALLEDRSAVIADLGACLGCPPVAKSRDGFFLLMNAKDKLAGFCVGGNIERFECPPEQVLPLPPAVATPVADTCAVRGSSLIPIINIGHLHDRLKQGLLELPLPERGTPAGVCDLSGLRSVRVLSVGGAQFCVNAGDTAYALLGEGGIAQLPVLSRRIAGVVLHDGAAVPVMLPETILGCAKSGDKKGILLAGPYGARYAVAVDQDLGTVEGADLAVLALPKLAAKPWLPAAALAKKKICLFVDSNVFAAPEDLTLDQAEKVAFTSSSQFPKQFLKSDTAIVEFSLLGTRHAVPQEEMKDDLALLPFVPVPGTIELVLGVAELRGELLPVLDLAALFGRRSPIGKRSRMMHIVNGDFQALVITDEVAGSRRLPVETHRQVPIALPHQVLYGCYLDEGMVRLVLNVEALAVHFEKIAVRELVASLSPELMEPGVFETGLTATADLPTGSPAGAWVAEPEQKQAVSPETASVPQPEEPARFDRDIDAGPAREELLAANAGAGELAQAALSADKNKMEEAQAEAAAEAAARELEQQRAAAEKLRAEDEARSQAVEQARMKAEADVKAVEERQAREKAEQIKSEAEALARAEAEAKAQEESRRKAAEEAANRAAEEARKQEEEESRCKAEELARETAALAARRAAGEAEQRAAEEAKKRAAEEALASAGEEVRRQERIAAEQQAAADARKQKEDTERHAAEQVRIALAETAKREADETQRREKKEAEARAGREALAKSTVMPEPQFSPESGPVSGEVRPAARKRRQYAGIAAVIAILLILLIYTVSIPKRPEPQAAKAEKAENQVAKAEKTENQAANQKSAPQSEKEAPLYLTLPPGSAVSAPLVYTVVKDDNLWNIAKRFTGDPFNYPRVARDNSIATPDLIFPGQKIRLAPQTAAGPGGAAIDLTKSKN